MKFDWQSARFDYEPYPIGVIDKFLPPDEFEALAASYPAKELFEFKPTLGNKYSLSEVNHPEQYKRFVATSPRWRALHDAIKSPDFVPTVLECFARHHIDLGISRYRVVSRKPVGRRASPLSLLLRRAELSARFEFSMMGADGGHILPHTDAANKLITLVVGMARPGEWDPRWGGGTDVVMPRDRSKLYNHVNRSLPFAEVEVLKSYAFLPNHCVMFVKTFNSWHAVAPMRGQGTDALRRTLTINIEEKH